MDDDWGYPYFRTPLFHEDTDSLVFLFVCLVFGGFQHVHWSHSQDQGDQGFTDRLRKSWDGWCSSNEFDQETPWMVGASLPFYGHGWWSLGISPTCYPVIKHGLEHIPDLLLNLLIFSHQNLDLSGISQPVAMVEGNWCRPKRCTRKTRVEHAMQRLPGESRQGSRLRCCRWAFCLRSFNQDQVPGGFQEDPVPAW